LLVPEPGIHYIWSVRIIAESTLRDFWTEHPETAASLKAWIAVTRKVAWGSPLEVCQTFVTAKALNGERVRIEVAGGNYRMIVAFHFTAQIAFVKFIGTHARYDRIDALTIAEF
jgi:mRNA interferase HigB